MNRIILLFGFFLTSSCIKTQRVDNKLNDTLYKETTIDTINRVFVGPEYSKIVVENFLKDPSINLFHGKVLINSKEELISFAEPILFRLYGEDNIKSERPYEIYLIDDNWIMMGTLPKDWVGGTFTIVINKKTCEIIGITHEK
jgi:hypothetical protein